MVSVIIPCFNQARFLSDAIASVLNQNYGRHEIIVVNDGSSDDTVSVTAKFGQNVQCLTQRNRGLAGARNSGFRAARGELVLFLDADDWISADYLERQVDAAARHPDADVLLSDVATVIDAPGVGVASPVEAHPIDYPVEPVIPLQKLLRGSCPFIHSAVIRRSLIDRIGVFDERLRSSEDSDFWIRAAMSGARFVRSGGGVAVYRRGEGSLTSKSVPLHRSRLRLVRKLRRNKDIAQRGLMALVESRLETQRRGVWDGTLSYHTSISPLSVTKFTYHLLRFSLVDPGFLMFLCNARPWTKNRRCASTG